MVKIKKYIALCKFAIKILKHYVEVRGFHKHTFLVNMRNRRSKGSPFSKKNFLNKHVPNEKLTRRRLSPSYKSELTIIIILLHTESVDKTNTYTNIKY